MEKAFRSYIESMVKLMFVYLREKVAEPTYDWPQNTINKFLDQCEQDFKDWFEKH